LNETDRVLENGVETENHTVMDDTSDGRKEGGHRGGGDGGEEDTRMNLTDAKVIKPKTQPE